MVDQFCRQQPEVLQWTGTHGQAWFPNNAVVREHGGLWITTTVLHMSFEYGNRMQQYKVFR